MIFLSFFQQVRATSLAGLLVFLGVATATFAQSADGPSETAEVPEGAVGGFGDVNLFPKRVVIDGRRQIATVGLYNKTANEGDYEISVVDMAMTPEGQLSQSDVVRRLPHVWGTNLHRRSRQPHLPALRQFQRGHRPFVQTWPLQHPKTPAIPRVKPREPAEKMKEKSFKPRDANNHRFLGN